VGRKSYAWTTLLSVGFFLSESGVMLGYIPIWRSAHTPSSTFSQRTVRSSVTSPLGSIDTILTIFPPNIFVNRLIPFLPMRSFSYPSTSSAARFRVIAHANSTLLFPFAMSAND